MTKCAGQWVYSGRSAISSHAKATQLIRGTGPHVLKGPQQKRTGKQVCLRCHVDVMEPRLKFMDQPWLCVSMISTPNMSIGIFLLIVTTLLFTAALPAWPYNRGWDSQPSISFGLLILMIVVLLGMGRL